MTSGQNMQIDSGDWNVLFYSPHMHACNAWYVYEVRRKVVAHRHSRAADMLGTQLPYHHIIYHHIPYHHMYHTIPYGHMIIYDFHNNLNYIYFIPIHHHTIPYDQLVCWDQCCFHKTTPSPVASAQTRRQSLILCFSVDSLIIKCGNCYNKSINFYQLSSPWNPYQHISQWKGQPNISLIDGSVTVSISTILKQYSKYYVSLNS